MRSTELPIREPCHEDWDAMRGTERARHCLSCRRTVHDLSAMTEREARRLLQSRPPEGICIRYRTNPAGLVELRRPLPAPARSVLLGVALSAAACEPGNIGESHPAPPPPSVAIAKAAPPVVHAVAASPPAVVHVAPAPLPTVATLRERAKKKPVNDKHEPMRPEEWVMGMF